MPIALPIYTISKNETALASRSLVEHGLISINLSKQHRHTFENDMHI